jgi:imidazole glycerol-phosphate synthase subunit HisF
MLTKRIIPCLDIQNGRTVKGIQFEGLIDAGNPVTLAQKYALEGADELVFLDITASVENRSTQLKWVKEIAENLNIPFTVGGGIKDVQHVESILKSGADKVTINTAAIQNPKLVTEIAQNFGNQCVVAAVDAKCENQEWVVYQKGGREKTNWLLLEWVKVLEQLGAGEILFTSMSHDGTKQGFAVEVLQQVCEVVKVPVIASGGAGNQAHFAEVFQQTNVDAALAASIFHFNEVPIPVLKNYLKTLNIPIR